MTISPQPTAVAPASAAPGPRAGRVPGIEGCRALAAFSIVVLHVWDIDESTLSPVFRVINNLAAAVILFFALSAFLLYRPFAAAIIRGTPMPGVRRYARSRFLRIAPAYWVALLFAALILGVTHITVPQGVAFGRMTNLSELLQNLFLVQSYHPHTYFTGLVPAWSLTTEVAFYIALPGLVGLAWALGRRAKSRRARRNAALAPAALMLIIGLMASLVAWRVLPGPVLPVNGTWHAVFVRSIIGSAALFAFGLAVAVLRVEWEDGQIQFRPTWRVAVWIALLGLGGWALSVNTLNGQRGSGSVYVQQIVFGLCCGLLLALVVLPPKASPRRLSLVRVLDSRLFVLGGLISYSVYLWHFPIVVFLKLHGDAWAPGVGFLPNLALVLIVTVGVSIVSYRLVERPAMRYRARRDRVPAAVTPAPSSLPAVGSALPATTAVPAASAVLPAVARSGP